MRRLRLADFLQMERAAAVLLCGKETCPVFFSVLITAVGVLNTALFSVIVRFGKG
jgi:hypothetical protein